MTPEPIDAAVRLTRLWDELARGLTPPVDADPEQLSVIRALEETSKAPSPPPGLAERTWERITGETLPLVPYVPTTIPNSNGHNAATRVSIRTVATPSRRVTLLAGVYRQLAVAAMAGFAGGFLAGVWARVAMRVSGFLTADRNVGLLTENDAAVGQITFGGTMFIAMFGGMFGVVVGLLYLLIRRWLPGRGWQRPLGFGGLLLAVFGFVIMDESNPDYQLFGPAWLNVGSFSFAYIVMGFTIGQFADWLDHRLPLPVLSGRSRRKNVMIGVLMAPFAFMGGLALIGSVVGTAGIGALVLMLIACAWLPVVRPNWTFRLPRILQQPVRIAYVSLAIPSLVGLTLTVRAIADIVGG